MRDKKDKNSPKTSDAENAFIMSILDLSFLKEFKLIS